MVLRNLDMKYSPGNPTDELKHSHLEKLAGLLDFDTYVEFHSGEGSYRDGDRTVYDGSARRVMRVASERDKKLEVHLHEINQKTRRKLKRNIKDLHEQHTIKVFGDWRDRIEHYVNSANKSWIILIDPYSPSDYREGTPSLLDALGKLLPTQANLFIYANEYTKNPNSISVVPEIKEILKNSGRAFEEKTLEIRRGHYSRADHVIVIADVTSASTNHSL